MIDNFANLLNSDWGVEKRLGFSDQAVYDFGGKQGLLTVEKAGKINEFSGRVLEIEGVEHLSVEQAFVTSMK